jgi:hypothetical protein
VKVEAKLFLGVMVFLWVVAAVYGGWTQSADGRVEWAGFLALVLSGGLLGICGSFFWFVSRRIDPRPEDRQDAEIAEGAGELGFFSPGSYWPIAIAGAATVAGVALAFYQIWSSRSYSSSSLSAACCSSTTSAASAPTGGTPPRPTEPRPTEPRPRPAVIASG